MTDTADRIIDMLQRRGRAMTLRRRVGTTTSFTSVTVRGLDRGYRPEELIGGIVQGDREVILSNAEIEAASWPGPVGAPKKGDLVVIDGVSYTVQGPDTRKILSETIGHILQVRG